MLRLMVSSDSMPTLRSTTRLPTAMSMASSWLMRLFMRTPMARKKIRLTIMTPPVTASSRRAFLCPLSVKSRSSLVARRMSLLAVAAASADLVAISAESSTTWASDWYCW